MDCQETIKQTLDVSEKLAEYFAKVKRKETFIAGKEIIDELIKKANSKVRVPETEIRIELPENNHRPNFQQFLV